ncbi:unnamed protein product, partial [Ectocarpus fasciculatus]
MAGISADKVPFRERRTRRDYMHTNACTGCCTHRLMFCLVTTLLLPLVCSTTTASTRQTTGTSAFAASPLPSTAASSCGARGGAAASAAAEQQQQQSDGRQQQWLPTLSNLGVDTNGQAAAAASAARVLSVHVSLEATTYAQQQSGGRGSTPRAQPGRGAA